jgi:hypothetical protein
MPRHTHYVPRIDRRLVSALYHEAKHRHQPMTVLVDELLTRALQGTRGWQIANGACVLQEHPDNDRRIPKR